MLPDQEYAQLLSTKLTRSTQLSEDYYRILGLGIDAEHEEIKAAYRILAQRYHPDPKGGHHREVFY